MAESETDLCKALKALEISDNPDSFLSWFWTGTNGNNLIKQLNQYAHGHGITDRIRREKNSPIVYGIVVNDFPFSKVGEWKLVKVGFTHGSIKQDSNNRMEQLRRQLELEIKQSDDKASASILFRFPIGCVDTTPFYEKEAQIREKVGTKVKKEKAKECNLPAPTEWVLTTQKHIGVINKLKKEAYNRQDPDVIDIFTGIKAPSITQLPEEYKDWVLEEKSKRGKNKPNECHE